MKKLYILFFSVLCSVILKADVYDIIPLPHNVQQTKGEFMLTESMTINYSSGDVDMHRNAKFLAQYIKEQTGWNWTISDKKVKSNVVSLVLDKKYTADEGYTMTITSKGITIEGKTSAGVFYGVQALRKIVGADGQRVMPCAVINDAPRFAYRGTHLDCSRHFFPIEFIYKYIDILALHGVNRFHWHLTDDQGWRFEVKGYPELISKGSKRAQTVLGHNSWVYDETPYGGYYTQEQCRSVVEYAKERHIQVIPEIDMPGHMVAVLAAYPELGCTGGPYKTLEYWGIADDVLCGGNPKTKEFIHGVLEELCEVFPSDLIHLGGDECPKVRWEACPKCQAKIKELGITNSNGKTAENQLQSYLLKDAEAFLAKKGRTVIGWDEVLEGGLGENTWVMSWRGHNGGREAAKLGHKSIMTPVSNCYFDYYQTENTGSEPIAFPAYLPIDKVYSFEPIPSGLSLEEAKLIQGCQANLWTEYIISPSHAEYMLLPRLAALSEVQWCNADRKDYEGFKKRLPRYMELYDKLGYNHHK